MRQFVFLALLLMLTIPVTSTSQIADVDPQIQETLETEETVQVIISVEEDSKEDIVEILDDAQALTSTDLVVARITQEELEVLTINPDVDAIQQSRDFQISLTTSVPAIKADDVWGQEPGIFGNLTGGGQTICILDTGIDLTHAAFTGKIVEQKCYCDLPTATTLGCCQNATESSNATDNHGHGTHVSGIAMGNGGGVIGVAKNANVLPVKVCNSSGGCDGNGIALAIDYCINKSSQYNISVISISISDGGEYATQGSCPTDYNAIIGAATARNISVVVASGNGGSTTGVDNPACDPNATSVGMTSRDGTTINTAGNRGPLLDVMAPGTSIVSSTLGGGVGANTGTSMATPHVAGVIALLAQHSVFRNRAVIPSEIEQTLEETSTSVSGFRQVNALYAYIQQAYNETYNSTNSSFRRGNTTIFLQGANLSDSNVTLFARCMNVSERNFSFDMARSECVQDNFGHLSSFSAGKTIRFQQLSFQTARAYYNASLCNTTICQNATYTGGTLTFDVTKFQDSFTPGTALLLNVSDMTDTQARYKNDQIFFYANFSNLTGPVNTTDGACQFAINNTGFMTVGAGFNYTNFTPMFYNASQQLYYYNSSFPNSGTNQWRDFNVTCSSFGETLTSASRWETSNETAAPKIQVLFPNNTIISTTSLVRFNYSVNDNSTMANCSIILNGTINKTSYAVEKITPQTINSTVTRGNYSWSIECSDVSPNLASNGTYTLSVMYSGPIQILDLPNQAWSGSSNSNAFDLDNYFTDADNTTLLYSSNGTSSISVSIDNTTNVVSFTAGSFTGTELVTFNASDGGNYSLSNLVSLTVSAAEGGGSNGGGGGGGGGGGSCTSLCSPVGFMSCAGYSTLMCGDFNGDRCTESKLITCPKGEWCQAPTGCVPMPCYEEWMCNDWTACENGKQTRSCTEMNVCGTEELKPIVEQDCVSTVTEQPRKLYSIAGEQPIEVIESSPSRAKELAIRIGGGAILVLSLGSYLFWRFTPKKLLKRRK